MILKLEYIKANFYLIFVIMGNGLKDWLSQDMSSNLIKYFLRY